MHKYLTNNWLKHDKDQIIAAFEKYREDAVPGKATKKPSETTHVSIFKWKMAIGLKSFCDDCDIYNPSICLPLDKWIMSLVGYESVWLDFTWIQSMK